MSKLSLFFSREMCLVNTKTFGYAAFSLLMIISAIEFQTHDNYLPVSALDNFLMYFLYTVVATTFLSSLLLFQMDYKRIVIKGELKDKFTFTSDTIFQFASFAVSILILGVFFLIFKDKPESVELLSLESLCILLLILSILFGFIGFTKVWLNRKN